MQEQTTERIRYRNDADNNNDHCGLECECHETLARTVEGLACVSDLHAGGTKMKFRSIALIVFAIVGVIGIVQALAAPPVTPIGQAPGALMRAKMASSQKVLEALLRKDFDGVAHGALQMKHISEAAEWPRSRDEVYEHYSATFRRQCNQLESLAKKENHEGVTFTYLQMTTTCIQCHDHVRDSLRIAERGRGGVQLIPTKWPQHEPLQTPSQE
jgi:hypothetical protein